ncbi:hypothetical protein STFR1_60262 [Bacillus vallismortis]
MEDNDLDGALQQIQAGRKILDQLAVENPDAHDLKIWGLSLS